MKLQEYHPRSFLRINSELSPDNCKFYKNKYCTHPKSNPGDCIPDGYHLCSWNKSHDKCWFLTK